MVLAGLVFSVVFGVDDFGCLRFECVVFIVVMLML